MIRPICRDVLFLQKRSLPATEADKQVGEDLLDTLRANKEHCVGMAANMIGVNKRIIVVNAGFMDLLMYNPMIVSKRKPYQTEEGCLSLIGVRKTTRYEEIEVTYQDHNFKPQKAKFSGWTAQIIQHEVDHCGGIII